MQYGWLQICNYSSTSLLGSHISPHTSCSPPAQLNLSPHPMTNLSCKKLQVSVALALHRHYPRLTLLFPKSFVMVVHGVVVSHRWDQHIRLMFFRVIDVTSSTDTFLHLLRCILPSRDILRSSCRVAACRVRKRNKFSPSLFIFRMPRPLSIVSLLLDVVKHFNNL